MAEGGKILRDILEKLIDNAKEGMDLKSLDWLALQLTRRRKAEPAFLNYHPYGAKSPYPASICASVNEIVVHGLPNNYKLRSGDVLKIDFGVKYKGYYTDSAVTVGIGKISDTAKKIIDATQKALVLGIKQVKIGNTLGDIGYAIQNYVESKGFKIVEGLTGHGIGRELHEDPTVWNFGKPGMGEKLKEGMVLAIEPMVSAGSSQTIQLKDDSYATEDGSISTHFEHTVAITKTGPIILT